MLPPFPCDQTSVAVAPGAPAYQACRRSPSAVVMVRSSVPGGGSGTARSGWKIRPSSGTQEHPADATPATTPSSARRLEIAARRLLLAALDPRPGDHVLVAHAGGDHRVDVRVLVDHHLEEGGAGEGNEGFEPWANVVDLGHALGELEPVGLDRLHEVLLVQGLV